MNRELSSFDIYVIVNELQDLIGGYIDKIYQITRDELLIKVNNKKTNQKETIYIKNGKLFLRTQKKFTTPKKPSNFAMSLRKYLLNGRITEILQYEFDRIIIIKIRKKEGDFTIIFELFSNGNIILLDPNEKIILPLIKQKWAHRTLKSHEDYISPPSQINPFQITKKDFSDILKKSNKDLVRTLAININLGGAYAEELCFRAGVDKNIQVINDDIINKIFVILQDLLKIFKEKKFQPIFVKKDNKIIDILPIIFQSYLKNEFVKTDIFNEGLQEFIDFNITIKQEKSKYQKKIEKLERQVLQQKKTIKEFIKKIEQKKTEGDIIYLNFQICQELLDEITILLQQKEKKEGICEINKRKIVKNFDPTTNELIVTLKDNKDKIKEIKLDFRKTVSENAQNAYLKSKKFQEKLKGAKEALHNTKNEIKTLEKKDIIIDKIPTNEKQFWFERFRWFISSDGNIVISGRDVKSNEQAVKKYLRNGDRYVHADIHGAPSCIVKCKDINDNKIPISDITLKEACIFAGSYSKAWKQYSEAQVYWVLPEQVSKTPESGEYLPKGSFIIRGKRNYQKCIIEIALGEIKINDIKKIMGGPVESVKSKSEKYAIIKPGSVKKNVIANKLSKALKFPIETIEKALPSGDMNVIKTFGFKLN